MAGMGGAITSEQMAAPRGCVHELIRRLRSGVPARMFLPVPMSIAVADRHEAGTGPWAQYQ